MHTIVPGQRRRLTPLFEGRRTLQAVVESVLEGHLGRAEADDPLSPVVARLSVGCYAVFGGDAEHARAEELVSTVPPPRELLFPDDEAWRELIRRVHGELPDRSMRTFDTRSLDVERLRRIAAAPPDGFRVSRFDRRLAEQLGPELVPNAMQVFDSVEDFVARGAGACVLDDDTVASAATSYTFSERRIELAIATRPGYRRLGLARVAAAALMADCLRHGTKPEWSAANPVSVHLAETLGYRPADICEVLFLAPSESTGSPASSPGPGRG